MYDLRTRICKTRCTMFDVQSQTSPALLKRLFTEQLDVFGSTLGDEERDQV